MLRVGVTHLHRISAARAFACALLFALILAQAPLSRAQTPWGPGAKAVQLHSFKTHSRLVVRSDEGIEPEIKKIPSGMELYFKGLSHADFSVALSELAQFELLKDSRLKSLVLKQEEDGIRLTARWNFPDQPRSDDDPSVFEMETFTYRSKTPASFVIDFWQKKVPTLGEVRITKARKEREAAEKVAKEEAMKRTEARLTREKARAEADDVDKFCRQPLSEIRDTFLPFRPQHEKVNFERYFSTRNVDSSFTYFRPKKPKGGIEEPKDSGYVRLALELYDKGKIGLTLRTLDFLEEEVPNSKHRAQMRLLRAGALIRLNQEDKAIQVLQRVQVEDRDTPVAIHAGIFVALRSLAKGQTLQALEGFLWLTKNYPEDKNNWLFHLGAAEALYALEQVDRASGEYQWVMDHAPTREVGAEAATKIGNLYLERGNYDEALVAYTRVYSYFPEEAKRLPTAKLNRAEALYWLGQFERSEQEYREFLKEFPSHPGGWRALFRVGEVLGRREGDEYRSRSREFFYDTVNRFPFSPGATLARLRLLPCGDHGGFDLESMERFMQTDVASFDASEDMQMEKFPDLRALAYSRALIALKAYPQAVRAMAEQIAGKLQPETRLAINNHFGPIFRSSVMELIHQGRIYDALRFYYEHVSIVPRFQKAPREFGVQQYDFLLKLSLMASDYGLGSKAAELAEAYQRTQRSAEEVAIHGTSRELASEHKPGDKVAIDVQFEVAEQNFTAAKALWIERGMQHEAKIREHLGKIADESQYSYERELILGLLDDAGEKPASALSHVMRAQLLTTTDRQEYDDQARILGWMARLQAKSGDTDAAVASYKKLESLILERASPDGALTLRKGIAGLLGVPPVIGMQEVLLEQGALYESTRNWGEAARIFERAVQAGIGGNQAVYRYASALEKVGDRDRSRQLLKQLAELKDDDFWKKMARENLESQRTAAKAED